MSDYEVGTRVEVNGVPGTVKYCGATSFAMGKWVGIALDTPTGKNDGSVQGKRYFDCEPNFGVFIRVTQVKLLGEQVYLFKDCIGLTCSLNRGHHRAHRKVLMRVSDRVLLSILLLLQLRDRPRLDGYLRFPRPEIKWVQLQPRLDEGHRFSHRAFRQLQERQ